MPHRKVHEVAGMYIETRNGSEKWFSRVMVLSKEMLIYTENLSQIFFLVGRFHCVCYFTMMRSMGDVDVILNDIKRKKICKPQL